MHPYGIKQQPFVRVDEPVVFITDPKKPPQHQFLFRLERHLRLCANAQLAYPDKVLAVKHFIMRPQNAYGEGFEEKPWTSSECGRALWQLYSGRWLLGTSWPVW